MDPDDRRALEAFLDSGGALPEEARDLLSRLEGPDPPAPPGGAAEVYREAEALADALAGLEEAFHKAGQRRKKRRSAARVLGRAFHLRDRARTDPEGGTAHLQEMEAQMRSRWRRNRFAVGRIAGEVDREVKAVHGAFLARCPTGPPDTALLHAAFAALAADTRGTSRWEAVFEAIEERLAALEREHLRLRARALLGGDPGPR